MNKRICLFFVTVLLLTTSIVCASQVETITVDALNEQTFTQNLNEGQKFSASLSVSGGLADNIIFSVKSPNGTEILNLGSVSEGTQFEFLADQNGAYTLVFTNLGLVSRTVNLTYDIETITIAGLDGTQILIAAFLVILVIVVGIIVIFKNKKTN